nr:putative ribonuclease H-like domain-containing protein [Tanacetum cinerariifolium]
MGLQNAYEDNAYHFLNYLMQNENDFHVSPSGSDKPKKHDDKDKRDDKRKSPIYLSIGVRELRAEFEEFSINSTNKVNAASAPVTAAGLNLTNSTNNFNTASPSDTAVSPNFGIARKSSFVDPFNYPNDPDMPALEDIVYSDDEEDVGAEADFSNLETNIYVSPIPTTKVHKDHHVTQIIGDLNSASQTRSMARMEEGIDYDDVFAPVARIKAIRLFLAYASFMGFMVYQMDVKSAFLYRTIEEEVYVYQPLGFKDTGYPDKVYKMVKALYGLHQAPRAWYETLTNYLLENGFQRGKIDHALFIKKQKGDILLVQVYVDDIIFRPTNKELCKAFERLIKDKFQMSSMGELTFFLGLQVKQKVDGIFISQDKYVAKILRKFAFTDVKSASTSIKIEKPLLKDHDGEDVDVHIYRSMIGSLMYLTLSRPNIMFFVCACARFQVTPKVSQLHAVKRIFRYLKGKPHLGLSDSLFNLAAYSDSDYAGASLDMKSTTGGCQFLSCRLISWQCKKHSVVATSSTEAEYVATASCSAQVLWIQNQLLEYRCCCQVNAANAVEGFLYIIRLIVCIIYVYKLSHTTSHIINPTHSIPPSHHHPKLAMAPLTFADTHNMVTFLSMSDASAAFDQIASATIKKVNDVVQLRALINRKKVVVTKDVIRQDLRLDDADGVECLPNEEIFTELARMGYKKPPPKLTFYKAFFSSSCSMEYAVICLATGRKFNFSKYILDSMVRNVDSSSKFLMYLRFLQFLINTQVDDLSSHNTKYTSYALTQKDAEEEDDKIPTAPTPPSLTNAHSLVPQDPIPPPLQAQPVAPHATPPQEQPTETSESSMSLLNTLMETSQEKGKEVREEEEIKAFRVKKDKEDDVSVATKDANVAEPIVFDDEEVTMTMAQTLIKMKEEKAKLFDEQMAKRLHDQEVKQAAAREKQEKDDLERAQVLQQKYDDKEENINWNVVTEQVQEKYTDNIRKYQNLKRKPVSIAQARKNMIISLKNMAGYKMEHFRGMTYDKVRAIFKREYKKVQTLFKPDKDVKEPQKKRVAEETLL